jgi:hypothetical protein
MNISNQPTEAFGATRDFISSLSESWLPIRQSDIDRNNLESHHYNPLRSITIKETDHSRILGELLKPDGSHGKGTLFLDSFLKRIGITPVDGKWIVTVESDRIDILLRRESPPSVVIIENKSCKASDQPGQLYRYWFRQIFMRYPSLRYDEEGIWERFRIIYLPPSGYTRPAESSLLRPGDKIYAKCDYHQLPQTILDCRSFAADVADWLNELVATESDCSHRLRTFLNLYAQIWRL